MIKILKENWNMQKCLTKDGRHFNIRRPNENEADNIISYSRMLFASTDQVLTTPEEYGYHYGKRQGLA